MSTLYGDISPRTAAYAEKKLLERGIPYLILEKFGQSKALPGNSTKVMKFRRYNALDNTPVELAEGVTPASQNLNITDVTVTLKQYGGLVTISDVIMDTHEDQVLNESVNLIGEQAAQLIEKMRFGVVKAGTNVMLAGASGAVVGARNLVTGALSLSVQRRATRSLKRQNGRPITSIVRSTPSYGSENVAPAFIGLIHPDLEGDVRNMTNFTPAEKYGTITPFENELGKVEDVRYLSSTIFEPWINAGAANLTAEAGTTKLSSNGTNVDVYPVLYLAANAYAIVALKGAYAVTPMVVNPKPSDSDPLAQRGHVSFKAMQAAAILNDSWLLRAEVGANA